MDSLFGFGSLLIILLILFGVIMLLYFIPVRLWITAIFSGVHLKLFRDLVGMRLRRVPPDRIVKPLITAHKAGIPSETPKLEAHFLAGGNVQQVINALISADKADIDLPFERATAIDLAGRDVFEAVQVSVNPKVIETPPISAIAKDGIQLRAIARVTVRANIERLVGGAGEETIIARVGEGIVSTIGSSDSHAAVLENPDIISKTVLAKGLDSGTAFEILSIDIADVDVGENIGAKLQTDQAEADLQVARAKAEERRAAAVALEQEMVARVQEARARVVEAEALVPEAMADAFRNGQLGVMDYYNLRNIEADTDMRSAIGGTGTGTGEDDSK
ncbi:MAG: flotillin-like protein FloA [Rhodothermaceae bacterium]|nr:flotillin-like protein FloA [Rhodothermaceae bacterium]MXX57764.1 flotillin-like protein FloA [Rhodothermaceae bacterium]MYD19407.1 flotillin-like protein FloA [Rhodothermaceae bacterium]MYD56305.1 flotillin-like protein FloA [Rhodothermaceae bacterium]MYI43057.1 flotillin-like protein FloA [Rhodothermaceae bacterium]